MPNSWNTYYDLYKNQIKTLSPKKILDVGPGVGTYGKLSREVYQNNIEIDAVEPTREYIQQYELNNIYNHVYNMTIQEFLLKSYKNEYDVAVCGDILEHLFLHEAISVVDCLLYRCDKVIIIWPTNLKQHGDDFNNQFETHRSNITINDLVRFNILFYTKTKISAERDVDGKEYLYDNVFYHHIVVSK